VRLVGGVDINSHLMSTSAAGVVAVYTQKNGYVCIRSEDAYYRVERRAKAKQMPQRVYDSVVKVIRLLMAGKEAEARSEFIQDKKRFQDESLDESAAKAYPNRIQFLTPHAKDQQFALVESKVLYRVHHETKALDVQVVPCDTCWEWLVSRLIRFDRRPSSFADALSKEAWIPREYLDSFLASGVDKIDVIGMNVVRVLDSESSSSSSALCLLPLPRFCPACSHFFSIIIYYAPSACDDMNQKLSRPSGFNLKYALYLESELSRLGVAELQNMLRSCGINFWTDEEDAEALRVRLRSVDLGLLGSALENLTKL